ncbi:DNA methyltransferase [Rufibacter roseus]|uniref:Methyltransferase n=1 Tax=Rufibacter roseus TaxID=1567108 RepID=A0ABW2DJK2_9BACT|nr:DNA methyltransferase [Rufibacter roseus]
MSTAKPPQHIQMLHLDRMALMARYPDKYFNIAFVDPEYGIGEDGKSNHSRGSLATATKFTPKQWDREPPPQAYFDELQRVSKHQIIWGGNYFSDKLPPSAGWVIWDKVNGLSDQADCELAWTSFDMGIRIFRFMWAGMRQGKSIREGHVMQGNKKLNEKRRHPTQKPRALYKWMYERFCKPNFKVLDTGFGSGNSAIEAFFFLNPELGGEYVGCDIDEEYFNNAVAEFESATQPLPLLV